MDILVVGQIKERATFVSDFWELSHYFFQAPKSYDEKAAQKAIKEDTPSLLSHLKSIIKNMEDYSADNIQTVIKGWITEQNIGFGKVMMPLRLALVGALQGPDVFDIMFLIGKDETISRIEHLVSKKS